MEIKISTKQILKVLYILSWLIFVGICIEAGGMLFNSFYTLIVQPAAAENFWNGLNLSSLLAFDRGHFTSQVLLMIIVAVLKAILFYLIVKILHDKKLNLKQPFNKEVGQFIFNIAFLSFGIGLFSTFAVNHANWLINQGIVLPNVQSMKIGGADVWLFMGIVLYVIAQIFKRGIEIQEENELTV